MPCPSAFNLEDQTVTLGCRRSASLARRAAAEELAMRFMSSTALDASFAVRFRIRNATQPSFGSIAEVEPAKPESQLQLNLCVALLKGEKFDLVVQKATELGVKKIVPLITRYADIHLRDEADAGKRVARWQRIALEAAKQSGRAFVPEVSSPVSFDSLLAGKKMLSLSDVFGTRWECVDSLIDRPAPQSITALIGSEGGWSDEEIEQRTRTSFHVVTLGGRILRAETAAITMTALLQHLFGDLNDLGVDRSAKQAQNVAVNRRNKECERVV